jgi:hypothetical protein
VDDETSVKLLLVQPTRRRDWELRQGDELVAELRLPALRSGGSARAGDRELAIATHGLFKREHVVADAATGEEVARVRGHTVDVRGLERADWKSLGRGQGYGLVGPDGEPWLRAKVKSGTFRTTGQVEIAAGHDPALPSLIAAYLLIRKADEAAAAASATVAAT